MIHCKFVTLMDIMDFLTVFKTKHIDEILESIGYVSISETESYDSRVDKLLW